ncbi:MAG: hypothetical protein OQJ81_04300 [Melioribacteraceae bacterium]|nr:hypothetical protein [Melioribacteraceae bacterium]
MSALIWFLADIIGGHIYSATINLVWNSIMRLILFLTIANLITYFKNEIIENHNKELTLQKNKNVIEMFQKLTLIIVDNIIVQNAEIIKWVNNQKEEKKIVPEVLERSSSVIGESMKVLTEVSFVSPYITNAETDIDMYLEILKKKLLKVKKDISIEEKDI